MEIKGIISSSRACVFDDWANAENGSMIVVGDIIITKLGFLFFVEFNSKLAFYTLEEVVEEVLDKAWKE